MYTTKKRNNLIHYSLIACLSIAMQMLLTGCGGGTGSAQDRTGSVTTPDTTSPVILSTTPLSGANSVATNSAVTVNFSEAINPATVTTTTFNVSGVSGTVSLSGDNSSAIFTPSTGTLLTANTTYTINLSTNIKDLSGNSLVSDINRTFITAAVADTTAPGFASSTPANGASNVAASDAITASFTEAINPATLTSTTFVVRGASAVAVTGTIAVSSDNRSAIFLPSTVLSDGTTYTATLTTGIEDMAKNALASSVSWRFTTAFVSPTVGKNILINGGFDIWQRGTSFTPTAAVSAYTADRWLSHMNTANLTVSQQTSDFAPSRYSIRTQRNNASSAVDVVYLEYNMATEDAIRLRGQTVTWSFAAKAGASYSGATGLLGVLVQSGTGTDQRMISGFTGVVTLLNSNVALTTTTQRFTQVNLSGLTFTVPSNASELGLRLSYSPNGIAGAADYFEVAQAQLEASPVATSFEQRSIGEELALCQRYYQTITGVHSGYAASPVIARAGIQLKGRMRAGPTLDKQIVGVGYVNNQAGNPSITSYTFGSSLPNSVVLDFNTGGTFTVGQGVVIYAVDLLTVSAEL